MPDQSGLQRSNEERAKEARNKAIQAIAALRSENEQVNFSTVSIRSGVSRRFLYRNTEIRTLIEESRKCDVNNEINRRARWYYYAAIASRGIGNNVTALDYAKRAADMEPDNQMYAMLVNQMTNSGTWYQNQNRYYGFGGMNNVSQQQMCYYLCLANMLCNCCMGGRGGFFFF